MARRSKTTFGDDVIALVALMPWWAGILLAGVLFSVFHHLAIAPIPSPVVEPGKPISTAVFIWPALRASAMVAQYLLPLLCLAGAGVSLAQRRQRRALVERATELQTHSATDDMTWQEFEMLVAEAFRLRGYQARETGGSGPDGGVDVVLTKKSETFLVQCKHWRAQRVGVEIVRELYGVMAAKGATGGFAVTSGRFSSDARSFAEGRNIQLIDGVELKRMLREVQAQGPAAASDAPQRQPATPTVPACPRCGSTMVKRAARQGASAGQQFWGCSAFPRCRGTKPA